MLARPQANDWGRARTCHEKNMAAYNPWPCDRSSDGAVVSVDCVESELDIDSTEECSLSTNSRPSLLDSLKCPKPSEYARKREK